MGIRVHKVLGYGLVDLQHDEGRLADPRIDSTSPLLQAYNLSVTDYLAWLEERYAAGRSGDLNLDLLMLRDLAKDNQADSSGHRYQMSDAAVYQAEYGLANVLLLKPITLTDWQRHDSPIDWVEETYLRGNDEPRTNHVTVLDQGVFPYSDSWMDKRSGQRLAPEARHWLWARSYNQNCGNKSKIEALALDEMARRAGFQDHAEAALNITPRVPDEIRDLAEYGHLFSDAGTWRELRPLLYVYWA